MHRYILTFHSRPPLVREDGYVLQQFIHREVEIGPMPYSEAVKVRDAAQTGLPKGWSIGLNRSTQSEK